MSISTISTSLGLLAMHTAEAWAIKTEEAMQASESTSSEGAGAGHAQGGKSTDEGAPASRPPDARLRWGGSVAKFELGAAQWEARQSCPQQSVCYVTIKAPFFQMVSTYLVCTPHSVGLCTCCAHTCCCSHGTMISTNLCCNHGIWDIAAGMCAAILV